MRLTIVGIVAAGKAWMPAFAGMTWRGRQAGVNAGAG
jgi:hypothetical protein